MLEELLIAFQRQHHVPYERKSAGNDPFFSLEIAPEFQIELRPLENDGLFLRANLFLLLDANREALYRRLAETNFLYQGSMGYNIGIDPNEKYVTLSHYMYTSVDKNLLWDTLEHFCNAVDYLRHNFEKKS